MRRLFIIVVLMSLLNGGCNNDDSPFNGSRLCNETNLVSGIARHQNAVREARTAKVEAVPSRILLKRLFIGL